MSEPVVSNKICGRLCVEMVGRLDSPLSIGSGEDEYSDADVVFNAKGEPYIPGSSLAGSLRNYANSVRGERSATWWFGAPLNGIPGDTDDRQSRIFIYDAVLEHANINIRDGVKLNEHKTAAHMGKYELQYVERGASVKIRFELIAREDCIKITEDLEHVWAEALSWIRLWISGFAAGELRVGARSRRGFGKIALMRVRVKKFDLRDKQIYKKWLDWDWEQSDAFGGVGGEELSVNDEHGNGKERLEHCLEVLLRIPGTLLVRSYAAAFTRSGGIPDYGQMTTGDRKQALIPGSSWAGAFRSQIAKMIKVLAEMPGWVEAQNSLNPLFGTWIDGDKSNPDLRASRIIFEDTVVDGGHGLPTARIAVDRFTGGTVQGALYEEIPWVGGNARLMIRWKKDGNWKKGGEELTDREICGMLLWAIKDLQSGILAVGGETSVGRGLCEPEKSEPEYLLDMQIMNEEEQERSMKAAALWVQRMKEKEQGRGQDDEKV